MLNKLVSVFAIVMFLGALSMPMAAMAAENAGAKCCIASDQGCCKNHACKDACVNACGAQCPTAAMGCCAH
jgi:hypothetical protein